MAGTDPAAPNFIAGYGPQPSDFNGWVQAPFTFLTTKVMFRAAMGGAVSLSGGGFTLMNWDTILEDPYGGWNSGSGTWTCPPGCGGWYEVTMTAWSASAANTADIIEAVVYLNGTIYQQCSADWGVDGHATGTSGSVPVSLYGGQDAISAYIFSTASLNTPTATGQTPTFEVAWISL